MEVKKQLTVCGEGRVYANGRKYSGKCEEETKKQYAEVDDLITEM